ncbi:PREDICTED: NAD(P)H-quinone oxidoreductase subunit S, chloroplastic isoform X1 [Theobroma cacao]|uniref:NAD(P)H-quinone oxidoreductase subunit S, chloroplastic isoform X1 n=1 Tax=Theobroma cacao TaxID=3641 RepID=A0AB32VGV8_THECC|nr:PREDICTED: NAD(P)H-quinone oxidoreductase subunit S, chloroplastic isoform X1 [Theobroma cacao]
MASSITLPSLQGSLLRSRFLGQNPISHRPHKSAFPVVKQPKTFCAKFDLFEILGGRGLCNGEKGLEVELKRNVEEASSPATKDEQRSGSTAISVPEDAFEKELMGLTGGFPGGEKGLKKFVEENPPPARQSVSDSVSIARLAATKKPKPPELPLLMPGMIAIVKNPNNPFYMYCGIVQRITDGKAGVLFEGGNWDRLITFRLDELERREKGPPMKNPKSAVLEAMLEKDQK